MTKTEIALLDQSLKSITNHLKHAKAARDTLVRFSALGTLVTNESLTFAVHELHESAAQLAASARDFLGQADALFTLTIVTKATIVPEASEFSNGPVADAERDT